MLDFLQKLIKKKKPVIGIDIGEDSIKLVELKQGDKGYQVLHIASIPTPAGALQEGNILDQEKVEIALMQLLSKSESIAQDVILNISAKNLIVRQIRLPLMPEKELQQAIEWETEKYIPMQKDSLHISFINFGEIQSGQNKQLNILVAAAPKDLIFAYYDVLSRAGLNILAIEVVPIALWHSVAKNYKTDNKSEAIFMLEMGAQSTTVVVYRNQKLYFTRSIPIGGNEMDKSISMVLDVSDDKAKSLKEKHGITDPNNDLTGFPENPAEKLQVAIKGTLSDLMQEIQRSINFYQELDIEVEIKKIIIIGGLANLRNIDEYISKELNIKVEVFSPGINPSFVTAYGLARRGD